MITASYLTLAGSPHPEPPRYTMLQRAQAAADAGITAIGIRLDEPLDERVLGEVSVPEAEWAELSRPFSPGYLEAVTRAAEMLGITRVNAGICHPVSMQDAADHLAALLEITAPLGLTVAVEPVAFGPYRTIEDITRIMSLADAVYPDAGLLYDMFHVMSGGDYLTAELPPIAEIQVCGVRAGDIRDLTAASQDRPLTTASDVDIQRWLGRVRASAALAPVSYEVPNAAMREMSLPQAAMTAALDMEGLV